MNYILFMKNLADKMISEGVADSKKLKGCSKNELDRLESYYKFVLPKSYKAFLNIMGHNCGRLYTGTDILYDELFKILDKEDAIFCALEYMKELKVPIPKEKIFVFSMHQGYEFEFFYISENNDPEVFIFTGEEDAAIRGGNLTFTQNLELRVEQTINFYKERFNK